MDPFVVDRDPGDAGPLIWRVAPGYASKGLKATVDRWLHHFTDAQIMADAGLFPKIMDAYMDMMIVSLRAIVSSAVPTTGAPSRGRSASRWCSSRR